MKFGNSKERLNIILFNDKVKEVISQSQVEEQGEAKKYVNIELDDEEEKKLDDTFKAIQDIKEEIKLKNLSLYLETSLENLKTLKDKNEIKEIRVKKLKKHLDDFVVPNKFNKNENSSNMVLLNEKDENFIYKFDVIISVS